MALPSVGSNAMTIGSGNSSDARASSASPRRAASRNRPARGWLGASSSGVVSLNGADGGGASTGDPEAAATPHHAGGSAPACARLATSRGAYVHRASGYWTVPTRRDSCARSSAPACPSRCEGACGSCICRRAGLTPGATGSVRVALNDQPSCPRTSPHRLTHGEVHAIEDMVTSPAYRLVTSWSPLDRRPTPHSLLTLRVLPRNTARRRNFTRRPRRFTDAARIRLSPRP